MSANETFVCVDCGCAKDRHLKHFSPEDRVKASVPKGGYATALVHCDGYRISKAERKALASHQARTNTDIPWTP